METLAQLLKKSREKSGKTLKEVQVSTGFSTAYISQLENGKIKKPSANVLYKLSVEYEVELSDFLSAAGIIEKKESNEQSELQKKAAFYADKLSEDEEKEVLEFIQYLRYRKRNA